ncbi:MAG TPA: VWA domain-containing protein, partial [Gemmatimonadaceae bacterium]|nr:VWA domain-containing protein [Gemmatimonadaceae bacterium]
LVVLGSAQTTTQPQTFRSGVELVRVPVLVTEGSRSIAGLTAADFTLLDQNVSQAVTAIPLERQPVDVTLVLDVSGSVQGRALDQLRADVTTIARSLQPDDRVRLITFGENVNDVFGFQPGGAQLSLDGITSGGATSLYAALERRTV